LLALMQTPRAILFVDGENLVFRYQEMLKSGRKPLQGVFHLPDVCVWHDSITMHAAFGYTRVCYYTSVVGDDDIVAAVKADIGKVVFRTRPNAQMVFTGQLVPRVFKKPAKSKKTRHVDIQIVIDVMRSAHAQAHDLIVVASGDGDYLPLFSEVMHSGKQLYVAAFSSGLNPSIPYSVDEFIELDRFFFEPNNES
jgi:uncharacterized LabA/DUF88 family protein